MKIIRVISRSEIPDNFTGIVEFSVGTKKWLKNGIPHRDNGPAIEFYWGTKEWCQNGLCHRTDGPAVIKTTGTKEWWQNGVMHRLDGAAVEWDDGDESYYVLGWDLTKKQFDIFRHLWENTLLERTDELMVIFVGLVRDFSENP